MPPTPNVPPAPDLRPPPPAQYRPQPPRPVYQHQGWNGIKTGLSNQSTAVIAVVASFVVLTLFLGLSWTLQWTERGCSGGQAIGLAITHQAPDTFEYCDSLNP